MSSVSIINGFVLFSLIITLLYLIGVLTFITDHGPVQCEMTYMFEYPQYVRIPNKVDRKYPKYGLYAYGEGRLTERLRDMYFDGNPVLFIPGNRGSHKQVRSLASIALRKFLNSRTPHHFDYFTVDLNEEYSGLNGALLNTQFEYVNHSIHRVLDLYKSRSQIPKSVILIGHSMGGIIARGIIAISPKELVPLVITLATPHTRPHLYPDAYMRDFYDRSRGDFNSSVFVSVSGGFSDLLVPAQMTSLDTEHSINVVSTNVPRAWLEADHLAILWCKQSILAINRALFDSIDPKTKSISNDKEHIKRVFNHHLVHNSGTKSYLTGSLTRTSSSIRNQGEWIEYMGRQYTVNLDKGVRQPHFYMVRLLDQPQHQALTVVAINLETVEWAFVCGAHIPRGNNRVCEKFTHLSHLSEISPSAKYKRRTLHVNMHDILTNGTDLTHLVFRVVPTDDPVVLHFDIYNDGARKQTIDNLPGVLSVFKRTTLIETTVEKIVHLDLELPQLSHVMQYYQLFVEAEQCAHQSRHATASLIVPWTNHDVHKHFTEDDVQPMNVRLYASRPQRAVNQSAYIRLTLDPTCRYRVSVKSSILGFLGQMARFYSPLLLANMAAVVLMTLTTIKDGAKPYYILTIVKLLSRIVDGIKPLSEVLPTPDWDILTDEGTDFLLLPMLLFICSIGIVWMAGMVLCTCLIAFETTVHRLALKFLARTVSFTVVWSDYLMSALHKVPIVVAMTLVSISVTTTGSLALCVGAIFYFLRLTQLSQDFIEEVVWNFVKKFTRRPITGRDANRGGAHAQDAMFFHATMFLLWCLVTLINVSSVLTWAQGFKYSPVLRPDPSFVPGLILSICALPLWQMDLPKVDRKYYNVIAYMVHGIAVISLMYSPISIYRLNYALCGVIAMVILHQVVAPAVSVPDEQSTEHQEIRAEYDSAVKTKLE